MSTALPELVAIANDPTYFRQIGMTQLRMDYVLWLLELDEMQFDWMRWQDDGGK